MATPDSFEQEPTSEIQLMLPRPSALKLPVQLTCDLVTLAVNYEQDLPHTLIEANDESLVFSPNWSQQFPSKHDLAYAMFMVKVPDYEHLRIIQKAPYTSRSFSTQHYELFTLAANFDGDYWDWISNSVYAPIREYSDEHILGGYLLVAAVATESHGLFSLLAGDVRPPNIEDVDPKLIVASDKVRFSATFNTNSEFRMEADSVLWNFGGGAWPNQSTNFEPIATIGEPGEYTGNLAASNLAGEYRYDFNYTVTGESFPKPLYLYAFADDSELHAGDETLVTIITGPFPVERPCSSLSFGLLVSEDIDYVSGSFNLGAPGGERLAPDGFWEQMADGFPGFLVDPESWIFAADPEIPGMVRYDIAFAPMITNSYTGGGEVCNFRLKFSEPGTYTLGFQGFLDVWRTAYSGDGGDETWYDISNSAAPQITVLP